MNSIPLKWRAHKESDELNRIASAKSLRGTVDIRTDGNGYSVIYPKYPYYGKSGFASVEDAKAYAQRREDLDRWAKKVLCDLRQCMDNVGKIINRVVNILLKELKS